MIKVRVKLLKKKCFKPPFKSRQRLRVFNIQWQGIPESMCNYRESEHCKLVSDKQVLPMTIPLMQKEDFDLDGEPGEGHKYV